MLTVTVRRRRGAPAGLRRHRRGDGRRGREGHAARGSRRPDAVPRSPRPRCCSASARWRSRCSGPTWWPAPPPVWPRWSWSPPPSCSRGCRREHEAAATLAWAGVAYAVVCGLTAAPAGPLLEAPAALAGAGAVLAGPGRAGRAGRAPRPDAPGGRRRRRRRRRQRDRHRLDASPPAPSTRSRWSWRCWSAARCPGSRSAPPRPASTRRTRDADITAEPREVQPEPGPPGRPAGARDPARRHRHGGAAGRPGQPARRPPRRDRCPRGGLRLRRPDAAHPAVPRRQRGRDRPGVRSRAGWSALAVSIIVEQPTWHVALALLLAITGAVLLVFTLVPMAPSVRRGRLGDIASSSRSSRCCRCWCSPSASSARSDRLSSGERIGTFSGPAAPDTAPHLHHVTHRPSTALRRGNMRNGRRLTAVGMLTGGLLLVGLAAPSLGGRNKRYGGDHRRGGEHRRRPGGRVLGRRHLGRHHAGEHDAGWNGMPARGLRRTRWRPLEPPQLAAAQSCLPADVNCHNDTCDGGFKPGIGGLCVPVAPCVNPPDHNGADEDGCGTDPDACPPGQHDYNQGDPGCGTDPDACPPGQHDYNQGDPGCGTDPDACPPGQTDYNQSDPGCGTDPNACTSGRTKQAPTSLVRLEPTPNACPAGQKDYNGQSAAGCGSDPAACTSGPDYNGVLAGCGSAPAAAPAPAPAPQPSSSCPRGHIDYNGVFAAAAPSRRAARRTTGR